MKRVCGQWAVAAVLAALTAAAWAEDDGGERQRGGEGPQRVRRARQIQPAAAPLREVLRQLELTDEQKTRIEAILAEAAAGRDEARKETLRQAKACREQLKAARESDNREAIAAARKKLAELNESRRQTDAELRRRIAEVLDKRQRTVFERLTGPEGALERLAEQMRGLNLTKTQQRQLRDTLAQARAEARMKTDPAEKATVYRQTPPKLVALLTDEQKTQLRRALAERKQGGADPYERLNLSTEQTAAIKAIQQEARDKVAQADTPDAKQEAARQARREARRRIFAEVLDDEQKKQFREQLKQQRRRQREGRPQRRRPGGDAVNNGAQ